VYADYVLDNSGPQSSLPSQISSLVSKLQEKAGWTWMVSWVVPPFGILRGVGRVGWRLWVQGVGKEKKRRTRGEQAVGGRKAREEIEMRDRRAARL